MLIVVSSSHSLSMVNGESDSEVISWCKDMFNVNLNGGGVEYVCIKLGIKDGKEYFLIQV